MPPEKIYRIYWKNYNGEEGKLLLKAYDSDTALERAIKKLNEDKIAWHILEAEEAYRKYSVEFEK